MEKMEFSDKIKNLLAERYPDKDIYSMSLDELKSFKDEITQLRQEYNLLEKAMKTLGNAAYGSSGNPYFYFFNVDLAGDITGECRVLTKFMWNRLEQFFHEDIWERKDLWEKFDFALDESKHDWYRTQHISVYSDTDSCSSNTKLLLMDSNGNTFHKTIKDLFLECRAKNGIADISSNGHEVVFGDYRVANYDDSGKITFVPIRFIFGHKVSKSRFKIKTKSGKEIVVTGDHSCIVFRNGKKIAIKASEINKDTDKILTIDVNG